MWLYSLFNGYMEHMNPTAALPWLGSTHAKGSYITLHKKSDFCQLLRTPSPKCVKLLRRFKGQKDFIFFFFFSFSRNASPNWVPWYSLISKRETPTLLGRTWKSHQLPHGSSQHWDTFEFVWPAVTQVTLVTEPALLSLQASHIQMELCKPAEQRAVGQQGRPLVLEMWVAQDRAVNP